MVLKVRDLKRLNMGELKKVVKLHKLGTISKKTKAELIGLISTAEKRVDILESLKLPERPKRQFSKAQIEAQERFRAAAAQRRKDKLKVLDKKVLKPPPKQEPKQAPKQVSKQAPPKQVSKNSLSIEQFSTLLIKLIVELPEFVAGNVLDLKDKELDSLLIRTKGMRGGNTLQSVVEEFLSS